MVREKKRVQFKLEVKKNNICKLVSVAMAVFSAKQSGQYSPPKEYGLADESLFLSFVPLLLHKLVA
jgi:hypothetical protein